MRIGRIFVAAAASASLLAAPAFAAPQASASQGLTEVRAGAVGDEESDLFGRRRRGGALAAILIAIIIAIGIYIVIDDDDDEEPASP